MSARAPVAVFAYRRPDHLRRTLESLARCNGFADSPLYLFADGAKGEADAADVSATRDVARALLGDRAEYRLSPENRGLSRSIVRGVEAVLERHARVIVVEDDMQLGAGFLDYMNGALDRYAEEPRVWQVSGYMFDVPEFAGRDRALFLPLTTSWGWGTWAREWRNFDAAANGWQALAQDRALRRRFNFGGAFDYASMLEEQMRGFGDSWAIRWYWSLFRGDALAVFPPVSMVRNTGMDGSGTHGRGLARRFAIPAPGNGFPGTLRWPDAIATDDADYAAVRRALWRQNGGVAGMLADRLRGLRRKLRRSPRGGA
jgi:hypothetical protein